MDIKTDISKQMVNLSARQRKIVELVENGGFLRIADLSKQLQVSEMSIRRDAAFLDKTDLIRRVRGGLLPVQSDNQNDGDFPQRDLVNVDIKKKIAQKAIELVDPNDVLAIDAGTTPYQLVANLPENFQGTIISHSLPVLHHLASSTNITTIALGGELVNRSRAFVGSMAVQACRGLNATTFFMGAAAVGCDGIYASWGTEKEIKNALAQIANRIVLLVDHTKFEASAPVFLMDWDEKLTVVTDYLPEKNRQQLLSCGVQLITISE